jgi:VanZ family protein
MWVYSMAPMSNDVDARPNQSVVWLMVASVLSVAIILGAPFIGEVRAAIRSVFPTRYSSIINGSVAFLVVLGVALTLARMRGRWGRLLLLVSALGLGVAYATAASTGNAEVDAVERFHFIEYGLLTLCFYQAWRVREDASILILPALAALLVGTFDEWCQWFVPGRVGEIHDVLLNGASIACGLLASVGINPPGGLSSRLRRGSLIRIGGLAAAVVVSLAGFLQSAHLGHTIAGEEIGAFDSRYTERTLLQLGEERAQRWRTHPPEPQGLLAREDQYLSEALFHVQERNDGDARIAWRENRILEKYFGPVLDIRAGSTFAYRWPPEQWVDMASRTTGDGEPYASAALPVPVFKWPKGQFWILVAALTCAIVGPCIVADRRAARGR